MKLKILLIATISVLLFSCSEDEALIPGELNLIGYWTDSEYNEPLYSYSKSDGLKDDQYCFGFLADGEFQERKNTGWCGTPPIAYGNYEGTWSVSDSIITIEVPYWGGTAEYKWKVVSNDNNKLNILIIETNYSESE